MLCADEADSRAQGVPSLAGGSITVARPVLSHTEHTLAHVRTHSSQG